MLQATSTMWVIITAREVVSKAWHFCHASCRLILIRLVAVLTSHANLAMAQGTIYLLFRWYFLFSFLPSFPGPFSCLQDFTTSEMTLSEMTPHYIMEEVTTTGKDDWGKCRLCELSQEHCCVSFFPWSWLQDKWLFLALWFIFWGKAYLYNNNTSKWAWICWTEMELFAFLIDFLFINLRDIHILALSILSSDGTHRSVYLDW